LTDLSARYSSSTFCSTTCILDHTWTQCR